MTLAAPADFLAGRSGVAPPTSVFAVTRIAREPWFAVNGPRSQLLAMRKSPPELSAGIFLWLSSICRCGCGRGVRR